MSDVTLRVEALHRVVLTETQAAEIEHSVAALPDVRYVDVECGADGDLLDIVVTLSDVDEEDETDEVTDALLRGVRAAAREVEVALAVRATRVA